MPDYLSCGTCCKDFELSKIEDFIKHKQSECLLTVISNNYLTCKQCLSIYKTPWSLLWHLQLDHGVQLIDLAQRKMSVSSSETQIEVLSIDSKDAKHTVIEIPNKNSEKEAVATAYSTNNYVESQSKTYVPFPRVNKDDSTLKRKCPCSEGSCNKDTIDKESGLCCNSSSDCSRNRCILGDTDESSCTNNRRQGNSITCVLDGSTTSKCCLEIDTELMEIGNTQDTTDLDDNSQDSYQNKAPEVKLVDQLEMDMSRIMNSFNVVPNTLSITTAYPSSFVSNNVATSYSSGHTTDVSVTSPVFSSKLFANGLSTGKRFFCSMCDRNFRQKVHLTKHLIQSHSHSQDKPFKCNYCNYSTVEKSHLTIHKRLHTGEKPFKCRVCGYGARQNCTLKHHYIKRHPNSKVTCYNCHATFITDMELERHRKTCRNSNCPEVSSS